MKTCNAHTKTAVSECSILDLVLICTVNSKLLKVEGWCSRPQRVVVHTSANASDQPYTQGVEEGYMVDKGLCKKCDQYFISMVVLIAVSSFVLFHAARTLELLE